MTYDYGDLVLFWELHSFQNLHPPARLIEEKPAQSLFMKEQQGGFRERWANSIGHPLSKLSDDFFPGS